jgi:hypothetical protein
MSYARDYTLRPPAPPLRERAASFVSGVPSTAPARPDAPLNLATLADAPHFDAARQPLSADEITCLAIAAKLAWDQIYPADRAALPGRTAKDRQDQWRHEQVSLATDGRADGLTKAMRADFRAIQAWFLKLAGLTLDAFKVLMRTGRTRSGEAVENGEQAEKWIFGILARVKKHFAAQGPHAEQRLQAWLQTIVAGKEAKYGRRWPEWTPQQKRTLYFTLKNRFAAMRGVGSPKRRNKNQRRTAVLEQLPEQPF